MLYEQTFGGIYELMAGLEGLQSGILWLCSADTPRQIYTSPSFERYFSTPIQALEQDPYAWLRDVPSEQHNRVKQLIQRRKCHSAQTDIVYSVRDRQGTERRFCDTAWPLVNAWGEVSLLFGFARPVEQPWVQELNTSWQAHLHQALQRLMLACSTLALTPMPECKVVVQHQGVPVELTRREQVCAYHVMAGRSAKETAQLTCSSPRTVENHLATLKDKFYCQSKLQLMSVLQRYFHLADGGGL